jgi:hypothetical protein
MSDVKVKRVNHYETYLFKQLDWASSLPIVIRTESAFNPANRIFAAQMRMT